DLPTAANPLAGTAHAPAADFPTPAVITDQNISGIRECDAPPESVHPPQQLSPRNDTDCEVWLDVEEISSSDINNEELIGFSVPGSAQLPVDPTELVEIDEVFDDEIYVDSETEAVADEAYEL